MSEQAEALITEFVEQLPERVERLRSLVKRNVGATSTGSDLQALSSQVHALHGSAASFGFEDLAEVAERAELIVGSLLDVRARLSPKQISRIREAVSDLTGAMASAQSPSLSFASEAAESVADADEDASVTAAAVHLRSTVSKRLLVVDDDGPVAQFLAQRLSAAGFDCRVLSDLGQLAERIHRDRPSVVIMDIGFPQGDLAGVEAIGSLKFDGETPAFVFHSVRTDMPARLAAMRAGAAAYFTKPVDFSALVRRLEDLSAVSSEQAERVLVVDDEPLVVQFNAKILQKAGMNVRTASGADEALAVLEDFEPELVLTDLHMPEVNGFELAMLLRQRGGSEDIPIVFLSADTDLERQNTARSIGADDYLTKPVKPKLLVEAVRGRVKRYRLLKSQIVGPKAVDEGDAIVMEDREAFDAALSDAATSSDSSILFHLAIKDYLDLDPARPLWRQFACQLRDSLRPQQHVYHLGHGGFLVLVRGVEGAVAGRVAKDMVSLARALEPPQHLAIGVAVLRQGMAVEQVLGQAQAAMHVAQEQAGSSVRAFQAKQDAARHSVEDQALAAQIKRAIKQGSSQVLYQPVISLHEDDLKLVECLIRVNDEQGQEIPLARLIPVAEAANLMHAFDRMVIATVLKGIGAPEFGKPLPRFFFNLSAVSLRDASLPPWLEKQLAATPVKGRQLIFQLAASDALMFPDQAAHLAQQLAALGCEFCLSRVRDEPGMRQLVDQLKPPFVKLDLSTSRALLGDGVARDRARDFLELNRAAGRAVIVGYVDDQEAMTTLWGVHADFVQGHFIGVPERDWRH